jgi:hypothetical protein
MMPEDKQFPPVVSPLSAAGRESPDAWPSFLVSGAVAKLTLKRAHQMVTA